MKITLHLGSVKTGSSSIQACLSEGSGWFRQGGWLVPEALKPRPSFDNHIVLPALFCDERHRQRLGRLAGQGSSETNAAFAERVHERFAQEIRRARRNGCDRMILSSEHLASRVTRTEQIGKLRRWLEHFGEVQRIVVFLRRQDELWYSLYSTRVKSGASVRFSTRGPSVDNHIFNHRLMLEPWIDVFADTPMTALAFESEHFRSGSVVAVFLETLGIGQMALRMPDAKNLSLDPEALEILRRFNSVANRVVGRDRLRWVRASLIRWLSRGDDGNRLQLGSAQARAVLENFVDCNSWLAGRFCDGEPFFRYGPPVHQVGKGLPELTPAQVFRRISSMRG